MAGGRDYTMRFKTDTTGFKTGTDQVIDQLNKFNKALVDNQYKQRDCNKVISEAQKKIKDLHKTKKENGKLTEDEEKQLKQLNDTIEQEKVKLSQLRTEQVGIRQAITETSRAVTENNSHWTVLKGTLANLASDTLKKLASQIVSIGKDIIQTGEQFSASMSEVGAISGATAEELEELEAAARLYGATTKFSATEAADALKYMALAGWDSQQAIAGLPAVLDLAAASGMDLGRASDIVTDYITAFGLEVEDASKFVDIMSYAMSNSNTTTEMLGEAYKNCAATAASMGFTVEETTAALMTMANAGVKGGEAGTTLNTLMTRLATNTKGCADELKKYGVEIYDSQGKMNSLSGILQGMIAAWDTLTQQQQANLSKMIAGTNQYAGFQTLMSGMSEKAKAAGMAFDDYTAALEQCDGTASDMAKTMSNNLSGDLKTLESALDELKLKIYDDAEQPLRNLVHLMTTDGVAALDGIVKNLKAVLPVIVGAATAMSTLKLNLTIGRIVSELTHNADALKNAMQGLTTATEGATVAQEELNVAQSANLIGLVVTAVMSLIGAFGTLAAMTNSNADATENANIKAKNYLETLQSLKEKQQDNITSANTEAQSLKDLQNEYDRLRQQTTLTAEEKIRLETIVESLAGKLGISTEALRQKDGAYKDLTKDIDEYIEKLKEQTRLENATNGLKEAYTAYDKAAKAAKDYAEQVKTQQEIVDDAQKHVENLQKHLDEDFPFHNFYYYDVVKEFDNAKKELEKQEKQLGNLQSAWNNCYTQADIAAQSIVAYQTELGVTVDEEKIFNQLLSDTGTTAETTADSIQLLGKTTAFAGNTLNDTAQVSENVIKKTETLSEKYKRLNGLLKENEKAVSDVNDEIDKAMDSDDEEHLEELQKKLKDLNDEQTTLKNRIKAVKDEIEKDANAIADAIEKVESSSQLLAKAQKEVSDNGKLTLNTLNSIQKKYPELMDVVNDYISGIKTEKDVIEGLKQVYENDVNAYNNLLTLKKMKQEGFSAELVNSNAAIFNKFQEHYDIDLTNFANAADAKKAIQDQLYDELQEKNKEYMDMLDSNNYAVGWENGQEYLAVRDVNGEWRRATAEELQSHKVAAAQKRDSWVNIKQDYNTSQDNDFQQFIDDYYNNRVSADTILKSLISDSGSDTVTLSGDGVSASGDTYTKAYLTWIDRMKSLGKMSLDGEVSHLEQLKKRTDSTADEIYQIDVKLYQARKQLAEDNAKSLADIEKKNYDALQERLNLAKAAYDKLVNGKIDSYKKEAQAAKDAADAEIAALDRVLAKRKQEKADEERQKKLDYINAQLRYKQMNEFNRQELLRQRQDLLNEQAEIDFERSIAAQKESISAQSSLAQNKSQQAIDGLNAAKSQFADHIAYLSGNQTYDQRVANNTTNQNIQIIQNGLNGDQIINKIKRDFGFT